jgi:hypothetical protein
MGFSLFALAVTIALSVLCLVMHRNGVDAARKRRDDCS